MDMMSETMLISSATSASNAGGGPLASSSRSEFTEGPDGSNQTGSELHVVGSRFEAWDA